MIRHLPAYEAERVARVRASSFGTIASTDEHIAATASILRHHLQVGDFVCVLAEVDGEVVTYGVGMIHQRLPAHRNPSGQWGYIQSMETHPDWRRRGPATKVLRELLAWFERREISGVSLVSAADGETLYRTAGFSEDPYGTRLIRIA